MYKKEDILRQVAVQINHIDHLYKASIVNYSGKTSDTQELYTEVIAEELLKWNIKDLLESIEEVERRKGYRVLTHDGLVTTALKDDESNRKEERNAIQLFNMSKNGRTFNHIGKILDYQIPLKDSQNDKGLGKMDLISATDDQIFLIEMKGRESKESLLRCTLEIATYYQVLSKIKFLESYRNEFGSLTEQSIKKAILIYKDSSQHKEMIEIQIGMRSCLKKLMDELAVQVYSLDEKSQDVRRL